MGNCPVCFGTQLRAFLKRAPVSLHQNLLIKDQEGAAQLLKGVLNIAICEECGFGFNREFDASQLSYGEAYDNSQDHSAVFQRHLKERVDHLIFNRGVTEGKILEIGCGKGTFLHSLVEHPGGNNQGCGFDPSYIGPASLIEGRLSFFCRFYDETCTGIEADVVICRHVIEHISAPVDFLKMVRKSLECLSKVRLFFETPCLEWILKNTVIWDFFYEHCSYFTKNSLKTALEQAGFKVDNIEHVFSGQYLWIEASIASQAKVTKDPQQIVKMADDYLLAESRLLSKWRQKISNLLQQGKIAIWGAGGKGVAFANLVDPNREYIECLIDLNPAKQNKFIPGTGHPILHFEELKEKSVKNVILMNPNYREENEAILQEKGLQVALIDPF